MCRRGCAIDLSSIPFCFVLFRPCPSILSSGPALVVLACALAMATPATSTRPPHPFGPHCGAGAEPVGAPPQEASAAGAPPVAVSPTQAPVAGAPRVAGPPTQAPASPTAGSLPVAGPPGQAPASPTATQLSRLLAAPAQPPGALTPPPGPWTAPSAAQPTACCSTVRSRFPVPLPPHLPAVPLAGPAPSAGARSARSVVPTPQEWAGRLARCALARPGLGAARHPPAVLPALPLAAELVVALPLVTATLAASTR